jgi:hypothetical protein
VSGASRPEFLGLGMTNLDQSIDPGLEEHLKAGGEGTHWAWDFNGVIRWDAKTRVFAEEVFVHHDSKGTRSAATLEELMRVVNEEFGWD